LLIYTYTLISLLVPTLLHYSHYQGNCTVLQQAVRAEQADIVRYLLQAGCDVTCKNAAGKDALSLAKSIGNDEIVAILLSGSSSRLSAVTATNNAAAAAAPRDRSAAEPEPEPEPEPETQTQPNIVEMSPPNRKCRAMCSWWW
jgi:ankyrin repeat protein